MRILLCISYLGHNTNDWVQSKINFLVGPQKPLLVTVMRGKLWFGHVTHHDSLSLSKMILQGTLGGGGCDAVVSRWNAGWTASKNGHPSSCQNCSQGPSAEKTRRGSLLNCPSCPPDASRDWTELTLIRNRNCLTLMCITAQGSPTVMQTCT